LTDHERTLLDVLLGPTFPGAEALRTQVALATVRPLDAEGGLKFLVPAEPKAVVERRVPVEGELTDADGVTVHVLVHVVNGSLDELEIYRDDSGPLLQPLDAAAMRVLLL